MTEGLRILNTAPIQGDVLLIAIGIFILVLAIISPLVLIWINYYNDTVMVVCVICGIVMGFILLAAGCEKKVGTKYEVIIENDSGYETIMKNYDILEQRGDIWVIKEKE